MRNYSEDRKHRRRADAAVKQAQRTLVLSRELLVQGRITDAARVTQLVERQAKLAERLIALDASLRRIAEAKRATEQHFAQRTAELVKREAAIAKQRLLEFKAEAWMIEVLAAREDNTKNGGW